MVSFSNFNLQMLQIVALCSQTDAHADANPKMMHFVHKLLQSVAEPKKDRGGCYRLSRPGLSRYPPLIATRPP